MNNDITVKLYSCGLWKYKTQTKEYKNKSELFYDLRHELQCQEMKQGCKNESNGMTQVICLY